jgi:hypothetical protein
MDIEDREIEYFPLTRRLTRDGVAHPGRIAAGAPSAGCTSRRWRMRKAPSPTAC